MADAFGSLKMKQLYIGGYLTEDGCLHAKLTLLSLTMQDCRKGTQVPRLLDKKKSAPNDLFVYMLYQQDTNGNKNSKKFFYFLNC